MNYTETGDFKIAFDARNLEIELFWRRSNYFLGLNTVVAIAYFSNRTNTVPAWLICGLGLVSSALWFLVLCGGKFWQSRWESKLRSLERNNQSNSGLFAVSRAEVRAQAESLIKDDDHWWPRGLIDKIVLWKPSVSFLMMVLSIMFMVLWLYLLIAGLVGTQQAVSQQIVAPFPDSENTAPLIRSPILNWEGQLTGLGGIVAAVITAIVAMWSVRRSSRDQKVAVVHQEMAECMVKTLALLRRSYLLIAAVADQAVYRDRISKDISGNAFERFAQGQPSIAKEFGDLVPQHELLFPEEAINATKRILAKVNSAASIAYRKKPDAKSTFPDTRDLMRSVSELAGAYNDCVDIYRNYIGTNKLAAFDSATREMVATSEEPADTVTTI